MRELLTRAKDLTSDMVTALRRLVEMESPSDCKAALDHLVRHLAEQYASLGGAVEILPQENAGNHLRVRWPRDGEPAFRDGTRGGRGVPEAGVLILCHTDTVFPLGTVSKRPIEITDEKFRGPGAFDMKGGIVVSLFALRLLRELLLPPVHPVTVLCTSDEEVGSQTSRTLIEGEARRHKMVFVLEPAAAGGAVKTFRKGVGDFHIRIKGRAAHAGADPARGVSAIGELARLILRLHALTDYESGLTVNVGIVRGGTRPNVVAAEAEAHVDVRVATAAQAEEVTRFILALTPQVEGITLEVKGGLNRPPMERSPHNLKVYGWARDVAGQLGIELPETGTGGGSDGNFTAALGIPTLDGLGVCGNGAHSEDEYVLIPSLPERAALLAALLASPPSW